MLDFSGVLYFVPLRACYADSLFQYWQNFEIWSLYDSFCPTFFSFPLCEGLCGQKETTL